MRVAAASELHALSSLHRVIEEAGAIFREMLGATEMNGGLSRGAYVRYLQMQYHLTKEVQRYFLSAAAHPCMSGKRDFREFLFRFALEEEPHYGIAQTDLATLGETVGESPLDVRLWHAYFSGIVQSQPYRRLGAAAVLETIGTLASDVIKRLLKNAEFLNESNTRFVVIHMHEILPHGTQFLLELSNSRPSVEEVEDIVAGAIDGGAIYLRMASWALGAEQNINRLVGCTRAATCN
jgi:hypothetical protein